MQILSLTFHSTFEKISQWEKFYPKEILLPIKNLGQKFIYSEIHSEMIKEGKNYNLLLFFNDKENQNQFIEKNLTQIDQKIKENFNNEVLWFLSELKPTDFQL